MFAGGDWCSLRYAFPFSFFSIHCPHCVRKSSSSISLRNAIKKSNSKFLSAHAFSQGGLRSLLSLRPSIPGKLDPDRPPPFILPLLRNTPSSLSLKGLYSVGTNERSRVVLESIGSRTFSHSLHFTKSSPAICSYPLVSKDEFLSCLAQTKTVYH